MIKKCNKFTHASKFYPRNFAVCSVDEAWLGGIAGVGGKFKDSNLMITTDMETPWWLQKKFKFDFKGKISNLLRLEFYVAENCPLLKKKNNVKSFILNIFIPSLTCHAVGIVIYIDKTKYVYQNMVKNGPKIRPWGLFCTYAWLQPHILVA